MANCKVCNERIDFDRKDITAKIGESLIEIIDDKPITVPVYGKLPYIRRGRWYWHPQCYPDTISVVQSKLDENIEKELVSVQTTLQTTADELQKTLEENSVLIASEAILQNAEAELIQKLENSNAETLKQLKEKEVFAEDNKRKYDELSIYKTDYAKLQKTNAELTAEVADYHKLQADLKEQLENGKVEDDQKE